MPNDADRLWAALAALMARHETVTLRAAHTADSQWRVAVEDLSGGYSSSTAWCPPTAEGLAQALEQLAGKGK